MAKAYHGYINLCSEGPVGWLALIPPSSLKKLTKGKSPRTTGTLHRGLVSGEAQGDRETTAEQVMLVAGYAPPSHPDR